MNEDVYKEQTQQEQLLVAKEVGEYIIFFQGPLPSD